MSTSTIYNRLQQVFCLNWLSNAAAGRRGTQSELQDYVTEGVNQTLADRKVQNLIGNWLTKESPSQVAWGPVVYQHNTDGSLFDNVADNTMFVAENTIGDVTTLVVAIAGTNPVSWYGWLVEDFNVVPTVAWSEVLAGNFAGEHSSDRSTPRISQATATGVQHLLLDMTDATEGFLLDFLTERVKTAEPGTLEVMVTGHSLGGALSATLALYLTDLQGNPDSWDPDRKAVVTALPSAGATPGNGAFAVHYDDALGSRTNRIWNALDVVPHAWELGMLNEVAHLYYPYIVPNPLVLTLVGAATAASIASEQDYLQLNHQTAPLPGQISLNGIVSKIAPAKVAIKIVADFIARVLAKRLDWPANLEKAVAQLIAAAIETIIKAEESRNASGTDPFVTGSHSTTFAALEDRERDFAAVTKVVKDFDPDILDQLTGLLNFLSQVGYQHVTAYLQLLQVTEFASQLADIKGRLPA